MRSLSCVELGSGTRGYCLEKKRQRTERNMVVLGGWDVGSDRVFT